MKNVNKTIKQHEIVVPRSPLPVWYFIFHDNNTPEFVAPHWHRGIELSYTVNGEISDFVIGGKHYQTRAGKILLINTQVIHSISKYSETAGKALSIIFPFDYVASLYPAINQQMIDINDPERFTIVQQRAYVELQALLTKFYYLYFVNSDFKNLEMKQIVDQVLTILLKNFTKPLSQNNQHNSQKVYAVERLQLITRFISDHYQDNLNLSLIAKQCNISKEYLARFFKKEMKITVDTYINNIRAEHAHHDLTDRKKSLTDIALNNGFSGIRTMNRAFKNLYGESASNYRRKLKEK